jgi:glycosyltransferase involved in cell wall biosynthesis
MEAAAPRLRILRVIARLNVGGPAIQAITLTRQLAPKGYDTTLVRGSEGPREGSMDGLAAALDVAPVRIASLRRELGPRDALAFLALLRLMVRIRPAIVHTHAAKAGTLGRLAAIVLRPRRVVTVHTFHGHVLEGYFSGPKATLFAAIERALAARTTRLIAVSPEVRDDLVRLRIAPAARISVVRLGFDLDRFLLDDGAQRERRASFRRAGSIGADAQLVTLVARLVPIKRVDRFLRIAAELGQRTSAEFLIVGDGELHDELLRHPAVAELGERLRWQGFTEAIEDVYFASDVVVLTSDNEGTPVSLIEAQACGRPVVSTDVGGVRAVVRDGETGYVVAPDAEPAFTQRVQELLDAPDTARRFGARGREHVSANFTLERLVGDLDSLYRELLVEAAA